jgi:hypothetical protein
MRFYSRDSQLFEGQKIFLQHGREGFVDGCVQGPEPDVLHAAQMFVWFRG